MAKLDEVMGRPKPTGGGGRTPPENVVATVLQVNLQNGKPGKAKPDPKNDTMLVRLETPFNGGRENGGYDKGDVVTAKMQMPKRDDITPGEDRREIAQLPVKFGTAASLKVGQTDHQGNVSGPMVELQSTYMDKRTKGPSHPQGSEEAGEEPVLNVWWNQALTTKPDDTINHVLLGGAVMVTKERQSQRSERAYQNAFVTFPNDAIEFDRMHGDEEAYGFEDLVVGNTDNFQKCPLNRYEASTFEKLGEDEFPGMLGYERDGFNFGFYVTAKSMDENGDAVAVSEMCTQQARYDEQADDYVMPSKREMLDNWYQSESGKRFMAAVENFLGQDGVTFEVMPAARLSVARNKIPSVAQSQGRKARDMAMPYFDPRGGRGFSFANLCVHKASDDPESDAPYQVIEANPVIRYENKIYQPQELPTPNVGEDLAQAIETKRKSEVEAALEESKKNENNNTNGGGNGGGTEPQQDADENFIPGEGNDDEPEPAEARPA